MRNVQESIQRFAKKHKIPEPKVLTVNDVAEICAASPITVRSWIYKKGLPTTTARVHRHQVNLVLSSDLVAWSSKTNPQGDYRV